MASFVASTSTIPSLYPPLRQANHCRKIKKVRCCSPNNLSKPENALLKITWYSSKFLGIAASFIYSSAKTGDSGTHNVELAVDESRKINRAAVVATIKDDFERSYFVTGNVSVEAYEEDCEFADPAVHSKV